MGVTAGASLVTLGLEAASTSAGVVATATGIAAEIVREDNQQLAQSLGWASVRLGIGSMVTGVAGAVTSAAPAASRATGKLASTKAKTGRAGFMLGDNAPPPLGAKPKAPKQLERQVFHYIGAEG